MEYRSGASGEELSILGFGCMRFQKKGAGFDLEEAEREILYAIKHGVNYFDTAYVYAGSEALLGTILAKHKLREKVKIATKLPYYLIKKPEDMDKYFNEQLKRLKTGYVDYYLMHMLPDTMVWQQLKELGIVEWIKEKKDSGKIRRIGFSYHGNTRDFIELLDAYPWEFCQIQYNYMDEHSQAGRKGLEYAGKKGIPVIIMEPLRGGSLVKDLPKKAEAVLRSAQLKRSPAEWAFRWLWNQKYVTVVLSGMNSMDMVKENIRIAGKARENEMTEEEFLVIEKVKEAINEKTKVPCTGCSYCMPCPKGVDIPGSFRCYNVSYTDRYFSGLREYIMCTTARAKKSNASLCIECGKCEAHCPQKIPVRKELKQVKKRLETPAYKAAAWFIRWFIK